MDSTMVPYFTCTLICHVDCTDVGENPVHVTLPPLPSSGQQSYHLIARHHRDTTIVVWPVQTFFGVQMMKYVLEGSKVSKHLVQTFVPNLTVKLGLLWDCADLSCFEAFLNSASIQLYFMVNVSLPNVSWTGNTVHNKQLPLQSRLHHMTPPSPFSWRCEDR